MFVYYVYGEFLGDFFLSRSVGWVSGQERKQTPWHILVVCSVYAYLKIFKVHKSFRPNMGYNNEIPVMCTIHHTHIYIFFPSLFSGPKTILRMVCCCADTDVYKSFFLDYKMVIRETAK